VPAPGEWQVRVWRQDAAGNHEPTNASVPVTIRYDPEPPQLGFEQSPAADPTLVSVQVTDKVSGLASGQIELSRQGSAAWQALPTQRHGSRLVARINDAQLPAGTYLLRATARDLASNQNSTDSRLDGRPMVVTLPLRTPTVIRAGVKSTRIVRKRVRRGGRRRTVRRRVGTIQPQARVSFGREAQIVGQLLTSDGRPVANAAVQVLSRSAVMPERLEAVLRTDAQGRYAYLAGPGSTRTLRFAYLGTPVTLPSTGEATLLVPAASTIRPRPRRLRNGQAVRFMGRLQSLPPPAAGKLVELQVTLSGRWQTFRTTRTAADGAWKVRYRFRRSCGLTRYRFRARLPAETGYPFQTGTTKAVKVAVRGPACR
jgi:5-hydroxyisourate hydrolase-like protein (transthyretin family)